ncbi:MAG: hypothetical protein AB8F95_15420 [Bacteroidia bacterium]
MKNLIVTIGFLSIGFALFSQQLELIDVDIQRDDYKNIWLEKDELGNTVTCLTGMEDYIFVFENAKTNARSKVVFPSRQDRENRKLPESKLRGIIAYDAKAALYRVTRKGEVIFIEVGPDGNYNRTKALSPLPRDLRSGKHKFVQFIPSGDHLTVFSVLKEDSVIYVAKLYPDERVELTRLKPQGKPLLQRKDLAKYVDLWSSVIIPGSIVDPEEASYNLKSYPLDRKCSKILATADFQKEKGRSRYTTMLLLDLENGIYKLDSVHIGEASFFFEGLLYGVETRNIKSTAFVAYTLDIQPWLDNPSQTISKPILTYGGGSEHKPNALEGSNYAFNLYKATFPESRLPVIYIKKAKQSLTHYQLLNNDLSGKESTFIFAERDANDSLNIMLGKFIEPARSPAFTGVPLGPFIIDNKPRPRSQRLATMNMGVNAFLFNGIFKANWIELRKNKGGHLYSKAKVTKPFQQKWACSSSNLYEARDSIKAKCGIFLTQIHHSGTWAIFFDFGSKKLYRMALSASTKE